MNRVTYYVLPMIPVERLRALPNSQAEARAALTWHFNSGSHFAAVAIACKGLTVDRELSAARTDAQTLVVGCGDSETDTPFLQLPGIVGFFVGTGSNTVLSRPLLNGASGTNLVLRVILRAIREGRRANEIVQSLADIAVPPPELPEHVDRECQPGVVVVLDKDRTLTNVACEPILCESAQLLAELLSVARVVLVSSNPEDELRTNFLEPTIRRTARDDEALCNLTVFGENGLFRIEWQPGEQRFLTQRSPAATRSTPEVRALILRALAIGFAHACDSAGKNPGLELEDCVDPGCGTTPEIQRAFAATVAPHQELLGRPYLQDWSSIVTVQTDDAAPFMIGGEFTAQVCRNARQILEDVAGK